MLCPQAVAACLVLRLSDLAPGFARRSGAIVSNAATGLGARVEDWGRTTGYRIDFDRPTRATGLQEGPLEIRTSASVYRTAHGAHLAFAYTKQHLVPPGTARIALTHLGAEAAEYVAQDASAVGALLSYTVVWREGDVLASIVVTGRVGVVSAADTPPLAAALERRIARALRRVS